MIEQVERFHCKRCDYVTENDYIIEQIKKKGVCPACQNGKGKCWVSDYTREDKKK